MNKHLPFILLVITFLFWHVNISAQSNQTVINGASTTAVTFPTGGCTYRWVNNTPGIGLPANGTGDIASFTAVNTGTLPITAIITATPTPSVLAYVSNLLSRDVSVISTATNTTIATIPVGINPYGVSASPDGSTVYVANSNSNNIAVISTASNTVVTNIAIGAAPIALVVSPDGSKLYVVNNNSHSISLINTATNTISATFAAGPNALGIAISPDGQQLYITDGNLNTLSIINASTGAVTATIPVGTMPQNCAVSPDGKLVYTTNEGSNLVSVIDVTSATLLTSITLNADPEGIVFSPDGKFVFVTDPTASLVYKISTVSNTVVSTLTTSYGPEGISISPDGSLLLVATRGNNALVINASTLSLVSTIADGSYSISFGNFVINGPACTGSPITFTITVNPGLLPVITTSVTPGPLSTTQGTASKSTSFYVAGTNLTGAILITPPTGFEVSTDNTNFNPTVSVGAAGTVASTPIYLRLAATTIDGNYSGNIVLSSAGANTVNAPGVMGVVTAPVGPVIKANGTLTPLNTVYGVASTSTIFTVSGINLTAGIVVTPPSGFEVSIDGISFSKTVTVPLQNATASVTIYVRLSASAPAEIYSHDIVLSSPGATDVHVPTAGSIVNPAPLTITADNKTKVAGEDNPPLTITYNGFVNNDSENNLTTKPIITTTAVTLSPIGTYPITVSGAQSSNYTFTYVAGVLNVTAVPPLIIVPNAFTPNNDGINDVWDLKNIESFPKNTVDIYNRYGEKVYSSIGYAVPWDGRRNGAQLPVGAYYYIINPKNGAKIISGSVTIIR